MQSSFIPAATSSNAPSLAESVAFQWARFTTQLRLTQSWWLRSHRPYQPVFVIATKRCGSSLLLSYLNQQPDVAILSEVLCSQRPVGPSHDSLPASKAIRHIRRCLQGERTAIRGCKLMLHQLANCQLKLDDLNQHFEHAKYIVLYRQSLADQFVAEKTAEATRRLTIQSGNDQRQAEVAVNPQQLRAFCDDNRRRYHDLIECRGLADHAVLLSYEEFIADPVHCLKQKVSPLLSVPFADSTTRVPKQNLRPLAEQIINYREVAALVQSPLCRQQLNWPFRENYRRAA